MHLQEIKVLLADDDIDDCLFFTRALKELNLVTRLVAVHDGEQLMHLLVNETTQAPDILFLDLNMPRKNGFECLLEIKLDEKLKTLPVIVFSTSFEQEVVNGLYKHGANYFIRKPPDFLQFKKIIQHSLGLVAKGNLSQPDRENFVLAI
jgi:CheY-like chemotaxis protein